MFDGMKKLGDMCLKPFGLSTNNFKLGIKGFYLFKILSILLEINLHVDGGRGCRGSS